MIIVSSGLTVICVAVVTLGVVWWMEDHVVRASHRPTVCDADCIATCTLPPADLDRAALVDPDDFRRTGDILRCCAGLMYEAAKATPAERVKLIGRTRNLTEHWFGVIGLDATQKG